MRHCSERRYAVADVGNCAGSTAAAGDVCRTRAVNSAVRTLCTARTEFHNRSAFRRADNSVCLCRDEALMVDCEKKHCFDKLRLHNRTFHLNNRLAGENRCSLLNRPYVALKFKVFKIVQKLAAEHIFGAQKSYVAFVKMKIFKIINQLFNACHNGKSASVGDFAEEHIKANFSVAKAFFKVAVCHGDFIKICEHCVICVIFHKLSLKCLRKPKTADVKRLVHILALGFFHCFVVF